MDRLSFTGYVSTWSVAQVGDTLCATPDGGEIVDTRTIEVEGLARWAATRELRVGWGRFPDGAEVIYLYDPADENFGYAFNVTAPGCSEWGYAPFRAAA
jgi:hypothetical protein